MRSVSTIALAVALAVPLPAQISDQDSHADHAKPVSPKRISEASRDSGGGAAPPQTAPRAADEKLPPDVENAGAALKKSPRHQEWVDIQIPGSSGPVKSFVVYPERKDKAPVVIVIHEIFGLSEWIRAVADQLAEDGFIAIAPDFLSGKGPNGGGTESLGENARQVNSSLPIDEVMQRLNGVRDYGMKLPASNGKTATVGFCWGGSTSFNYAVAQPALNAAIVYYGTSPADTAVYGSIKTPVLGLYGQDDARVVATIPAAEAEMGKAGKVYEKHIFTDAGHGFLRQQSGTQKAPGANLKATEQAWPIMLTFLRKYTT